MFLTYRLHRVKVPNNSQDPIGASLNVKYSNKLAHTCGQHRPAAPQRHSHDTQKTGAVWIRFSAMQAPPLPHLVPQAERYANGQAFVGG